MDKEGPKDRLEMDRLEMVSREPTWAKKVPRIDRLEMVSREPTWAKKARIRRSREPASAKKVP